MAIPADLFDTDNPPSETRPARRWLLVSNQRNLFYMLAAGMLMSPKGFGKKYYQDTLCGFPGWIPLFADSVPKAAVEHSLSERGHLIPCLAEIDLSALRGAVMAVGVDGAAREVNFPDALDGSECVLFIPAPLPSAWIASILFRSREDKAECEADARDFGNVPLADCKREVGARVFSKTSDSAWPSLDVVLPDRDTPLEAPLVAGAMMAMLLHLARLGEIGIQSCRLVFDAQDSVAETMTHPMISALGAWQRMGHAPDTDDVIKKLFWGAIDKLAVYRAWETSALDVMLGHLESSARSLDERLQQALLKLAGDLKTLTGFADSTITELFERHPKPFSRVMTLFFLRETCAELLEFRHPLLTETDYLAAALLFAARDGWLGLPLELRGAPGLQEAVSHRMATMAHRIADTGIDLGTPPPRPLPLRELLTPGPRGWSKAQGEAALLLARECRWDCIQTRISLGKGEYRLVVDAKGMHVLIAGEAKAVVTEVDRERFFVDLAHERIADKQERKVRDLLKPDAR